MKTGFHSLVIERIARWRMAAHKSRFRVRAYHFRRFCPLFFLIFSAALLAQTPTIPAYQEAGRPLIRNYTFKEYRTAPQTRAVLQDSRGMIYMASNSSVLIEFDGVKWRHILLPAGTTARSLAYGSTGRIYIGGAKYLGYLAADSKGQLQFQSLLEEVKPEDREFITYGIYTTPAGIYFLSRQRLFYWHNDSMKVWKAHTSFAGSFVVGRSLYVYQRQVGLMKINDDSLEFAPGGERFADRPVDALLPYPDSGVHQRSTPKMLLSLSGEGLFLFDGESLQPLPGDAGKFVQNAKVNCSQVLNDSLFAIGSANRGVMIFNAGGKIVRIIDQNAGLTSNMVFSITADREGGMWLALLQGFARVNSIRPAFTLFDERAGLDGVVSFRMVRHKGNLYVSSSSGIYFLNSRESRFEPVAGLSQPEWSLVQVEESLFAIRHSLRQIVGKVSKPVMEMEEPVFPVHRSHYDPRQLYLSVRGGGFKVARIEAGELFEGKRIAGIYEAISSVAEETTGDLWLTPDNGGVLRLRFSTAGNPPGIQRFTTKQGLPENQINVHQTSLGPLFLGQGGIFDFREASQRFIPDPRFSALLTGSSQGGIAALSEDSRGNMWISVNETDRFFLNVSRRRKDGKFRHERTPFLRVPSTGIWTVFAEDDHQGAGGIVWFGGEEGLFRYDSNIRKDYAVDYPALVRRVIVNGDSVIYGGTSGRGERPFAPTLDYQNNALRFEFAATSFEMPSANRYRFFLEGFDKDWSGWASETQKDYTNIPEGDYTFRVRARNVYEHLSSEGRYSFTILPPWYRTWWAYTFYVLSVLGFFNAIRRYEMNRQQLKHDAELQQVETKKLQEIDTLKSRFFANISHEFRTPLTLILGHTESVIPEVSQESAKNKLKIVLRNTTRLRTLVNQLLDLSKFEAGQMELQASQQDIVAVVRTATAAFESHAQQRGIALTFSAKPNAIALYCEKEKIEKVMYNLLSNALKFTQRDGQVAVKVSVEQNIQSGESEYSSATIQNGELKLVVRDSGIGIRTENLKNIFDRFYQVDVSETREYEGTGIGLALTQELVQLHGGMISVESEVDTGTTFTIKLPLGHAHLLPEQIVVHDESASAIRDDIEALDDNTTLPPSLRQAASESEKAGAKLVLIVEDNDDMRALIRDDLPADYKIIEAGNGEAGFASALDHIPDIIITDVMMPVMDGYELTRKLREHSATSHIPIIMLTAKAADEDKFEGLEKGVDVYLIKPFNKQELLIRVRKLIELRQQLLAKVQARPIISASEVMVTSMDQEFLERLQKIVEENMEEESFRVEDMARQIGLSRSQLQRKLSALIDCSPAAYLRRVRLERAKQLLEKNAGTVSEICYQVGYGNVSAFARAFRDAFGESPSSVRSGSSSR